MPVIDVNGRDIFYQETGAGAQTIVFSHGYLMSHEMFAAQIEALSATYRVIAFDHIGHGNSGACHAPFGIYDLVDDAARLIAETCDGPVHFAGMSTGGYVGLRLLLRHPALIKSLILMDTGANAESKAALWQYNQLLFFVRIIGTRPLLGKVIPLLFGQAFRSDPARAAALDAWKNYIGGMDRTSVRRFGRAIFDRDDIEVALRSVEEPPPTVIMVGEEDIPTPPEVAQRMHECIAGSSLITVPRAGHSSPLEEPAFVNDVITAFLSKQT